MILQYLAAKTGIDIAAPLYKLLVPPYTETLVAFPHWFYYFIWFALPYTFLWIWNDLFRIYKLKPRLFNFSIFLRLLVLTFGSAIIVRGISSFSQNKIIWLSYIAFVSVSVSEDAVEMLTTILKNHKARSEAVLSTVTEYVRQSPKRRVLVSHLVNFFARRGIKPPNIRDPGEFGSKANNRLLKQIIDELEDLVYIGESDGAIWLVGDLFIYLGLFEYLFGLPDESATHIKKGLTYNTFNTYNSPTNEKELRLLCELYVANALSNSVKGNNSATQAYKDLARKCDAQIAAANNTLRLASDDLSIFGGAMSQSAAKNGKR
jgi:hypothetical protein